MTSTLASVRRISVRFGATTVDLAVPLGTRLGDIVTSGGFPPGTRLVDASGAALPDDDRVGETFEDGDLVYVVDDVHTPSLTRVAPAAPTRGTTPAGRAAVGRGAVTAPGGAPAGTSTPPPAATTSAPPSTGQVFVDRASAGARSRSTHRRAAATRPGAPGVAAPATRGGVTRPAEGRPVTEPGPGPRTDSGPTDSDGAPVGRRAVVPPAVRRAPGGDGPNPRGVVPPPPGPTRAPVPLPPGRTPGRGSHAVATRTDAARPPVVRRAGTDVVTGSIPPPPRVIPPPTGETRRAAAAGQGGHRAAAGSDEPRVRPKLTGPAELPVRPGVVAVPLTLAGATAVLVVLASVAGTLPVWSTWTAGAALLLSGVVAALRPGDSALERWSRVTGAAVAGVGGFVLGVSIDLDLDVAAVGGLVVATAVAMLGRVAAIRQGVFDPWITVTAVGFGALALDAAVAIALSWPVYVGPLLLAGVSPLVMRSLPGLSLDVPEEQLIDTERLSNTSWSARTGVRRKRRPLRQATVQLITMRASGIVAAGTVTIAVFMTSGYGLTVLSTPPGDVARWAMLAEGVLLVGATGLAARTVRARFGKRVLRATAAVLTLETGVFLDRQFGEAVNTVLVVLLVVVALAVVGIAAALDVGWRSLRLSRLADVAEGFCVVFALPAALLACDAIAVLRQAAS